MWLSLLVLVGLILLYRWYRQSQILENLSDKYVFITGCDSGFGNLLAKQLDKRGMKVLASCLTEKGAENLKKEASSHLQTVILDVADSQSVRSAAKWVSNIVGNHGLWGLVNNAGFGFVFGPNMWTTREDFAKVVNINLVGLFDVTVNLVPLLIKARGRIVNVSSCGGRLSIVGGGYCPSKAGIESFSDSLRHADFPLSSCILCHKGRYQEIYVVFLCLFSFVPILSRRELRDFGVKVSIIEPGAFRTGMGVTEPHLRTLERMWLNVPEQVKACYGESYYYQYAQGLATLTGKTNPKLYQVTDCMEHAVTAVHPWTRYSPGIDCKLYYLPLSYLPTVLCDYLLCLSSPKPALGVM